MPAFSMVWWNCPRFSSCVNKLAKVGPAARYYVSNVVILIRNGIPRAIAFYMGPILGMSANIFMCDLQFMDSQTTVADRVVREMLVQKKGILITRKQRFQRSRAYVRHVVKNPKASRKQTSHDFFEAYVSAMICVAFCVDPMIRKKMIAYLTTARPSVWCRTFY